MTRLKQLRSDDPHHVRQPGRSAKHDDNFCFVPLQSLLSNLPQATSAFAFASSTPELLCALVAFRESLEAIRSLSAITRLSPAFTNRISKWRKQALHRHSSSSLLATVAQER